MGRGAWWAAVRGVAESWAPPSDLADNARGNERGLERPWCMHASTRVHRHSHTPCLTAGEQGDSVVAHGSTVRFQKPYASLDGTSKRIHGF